MKNLKIKYMEVVLWLLSGLWSVVWWIVIVIVNAVAIFNFFSAGKMTNLFLYVLALVVYANVSGGWAVVVWIILFLMWCKSFAD